MTRQEFLHRPEDIDLGEIFNDMRTAQREREWMVYSWNQIDLENDKRSNTYHFGVQDR